MKVKHVIEELKLRDPEEEIATTLWTVEDVKNRADDMVVDITDDQAKQVLRDVDFNTEITWDDIENEIEELG